jgi:hypothetical protein
MDLLKWLQDWSTPLSALATLAAVIVALGIGLHGENIRKREHKERLINEIIKWAKTIIEYSNEEFVLNIDEKVDKDFPEMKSVLTSMNENTFFIRMKQSIRTEILPIGEISKNEMLISSINNLDISIGLYLRCLVKNKYL